MITLTYGFGVALAALAGVLAAPIYQVNPLMGADLIIVVFAVVVIGGMGSIMGSIVTGFALGVVEGLTKVFYPEASNTVIFVIMAIVLLVKPAGLFGGSAEMAAAKESADAPALASTVRRRRGTSRWPSPSWSRSSWPRRSSSIRVFLMKALCFALFACAFNLLIGYVGLLSFGHAAFLGSAGYVAAHAAKVWGCRRSWPSSPAPPRPPSSGSVVGALAIRRQGIYFAMITLALAQMVYFFCLQAPFTTARTASRRCRAACCSASSTCADDDDVLRRAGDLPRRLPADLPDDSLALRAGAEGDPRERAARHLARLHAPISYKLIAFVLSATLSGLAGGTKALVFQLASLTDVHWTMSGEVVLMTLLGGLGTVFGPVVGAFIVVTLENYLAQLGAWVTVVQGAIFVVCVLTFRRGIVGELGNILKKPL